MKIQHDKDAFESQLPPTSHEFGLKSSPIAFKILSDGLYKNKIRAVIRELCCNAYDAHVAAGKEKEPFNLHLPTHLEPVFRVEDFGVGLPPRGEGSVEELYTTYFESTKRDSNKFIGALGLGSKSPFAYTNNFTVKSRWQGTEHTFICCVDQTYRPTITEVGQTPTEQPNGLTVEFAVKPSDFNAFYSNAQLVFKYWAKNRRPKLTGHEVAFQEPRSSEYHGVKWFIEPGLNCPIAVMGNVAYPINIKEANLTLSPLAEFLLHAGLVYRFKMGEVNFAPSREDLSYDGVTNAALVKAAESAGQELLDQLTSQLKTATTLPSFMEQVSELIKRLGSSLGKTQTDIVKFLTESRGTDKLKYRDLEFTLKDLLGDKWYLSEGEGHSHRGMYRYSHWPEKEVVTLLTTARDPFKALSGWSVAKWIKPKLLTAERRGPAARELSAQLTDWSQDKQKCYTYHHFSLRGNPIFVVDDLRSGGAQKAAAFNRQTRRPVYLLTTDVQVDDASKLVAQLRAQLAEKFSAEAPEVVTSSQLVDHRPPADRTKRTKANTTRLVMSVEKLRGNSYSSRGLFGTSLQLVKSGIGYVTAPDTVKFSEVTGYYVVRSNGSLYWDTKHARGVKRKVIELLVQLGKLNVDDNVFALTPKEVEKYVTRKGAKLKPLEELYLAVMSDIKTEDVQSIYTFEQLAQAPLFSHVDRLRQRVHGKSAAKKEYVKALRLLASYRRSATVKSPLNTLLTEARQATRALKLKKSDSSLVKYLLMQESTDYYTSRASVNKKLLDEYDRVEKLLLKHYPLIVSVDNYGVKLQDVLEYIRLVDQRK